VLLYSQDVDYYSCFERYDSIKCFDTNGVEKINSFVGGLNFVQFSAIDLNGDWEKDLVMFDRTGNRLLTFLREVNGKYYYRYDCSYEKYFPDVHDWILLRDYDGDGREDIFTYSFGGCSVYRNERKAGGALEFREICPLLLSDYGSNKINLFINAVDIPAIGDVDGDGDLDILVFHILGGYIQYHRNMSIERYGVKDSLDYIIYDKCWGKVKEGSEDNKLTMNSDCIFKSDEFFKSMGEELHSGSTTTLVDIDCDGLQDLLVGDVDYGDIFLLRNGGSKDDAMIVEVDTVFPSERERIKLYSNPAVYMIDVDGDGKEDMLVSANDGIAGKNERRILYYRDTSEMCSKGYKLCDSMFLLRTMFDFGEGSYPVFYDYNGDGMKDIVIGNYGYYRSSYYYYGYLKSNFSSQLALLENIGSKEMPIYKVKSYDWGGLSRKNYIGLYPTFGDIDGDGIDELVTGDIEGKLHLFKKGKDTTGVDIFIEGDSSILGWIDVGSNSTPELVDIDGDGLLDILCGNKAGVIYYYQNTGTRNNPNYKLVSSNYGKINVVDTMLSYYGYSAPRVYSDGNKLLLTVGSYSGAIYYFGNIKGDEGNDNLHWRRLYIEGNNNNVNVSMSLSDINSDGYLDCVIGNYRGGISVYKGVVNLSLSDVKNYMDDLLSVSYDIRNDVISITGLDNFTDGFEIRINDILGRDILSCKVSKSGDNYRLHGLKMNDGVYLILLRDRSKFCVKKLVIYR